MPADMNNTAGKGTACLEKRLPLAVGMALSCSEINASMQCIVACPTAGSCGIVPAVLLACAQSRGLDRQTLINALFTASAVGIIVGSRATVSGAEGGCQAECGGGSGHGSGSGDGDAGRNAGNGFPCGSHGA